MNDIVKSKNPSKSEVKKNQNSNLKETSSNIIEESGMKFDTFSKSKLFNIEKSKIVKNLGSGYKKVEFIALDKNNNVVIIEAKSAGYIKSNESKNYRKNIEHLVEKFENSINIFFSLMLRRQKNSGNEVGRELIEVDLSRSKVICYLIINGGKPEVCSQISITLQSELRKILDIYNIQIIAINDKMAKKYKLIS